MLYYVTYENVFGYVVTRPFTANLDDVLFQIRRNNSKIISVQHV